jgi:hypothetical protein
MDQNVARLAAGAALAANVFAATPVARAVQAGDDPVDAPTTVSTFAPSPGATTTLATMVPMASKAAAAIDKIAPPPTAAAPCTLTAAAAPTIPGWGSRWRCRSGWSPIRWGPWWTSCGGCSGSVEGDDAQDVGGVGG